MTKDEIAVLFYRLYKYTANAIDTIPHSADGVACSPGMTAQEMAAPTMGMMNFQTFSEETAAPESWSRWNQMEKAAAETNASQTRAP